MKMNMSDMTHFKGSRANDVIRGDGMGPVWIDGYGGNDFLSALHASGENGLWGHRGNDTLIGSVPGEGQIHMSGALGDDRIIMDVTNETGVQGHHVYGGKGADRFEFVNTQDANAPILGRIDDFDASQDSIWIEGNEIDLYNLPQGVELVMYQEQFWLKIGDNILYALEGARDGGEERHFSAFPEDIDSLERVEFVDHVNHVPFELFADEVAELNALYAANSGLAAGTDGDDWIYDDNLDRFDAAGKQIVTADGILRGGAGNDVIEGGKGDDRISGGSGNDLIAGGQDNDRIYGGAGDDRIWGGSENDFVNGGSGKDMIHGGAGDDRLVGGGGHDEIWGDHGNDRISGYRGNDILHGGEGHDVLSGNRGHDHLEGDAGDDVLLGGWGDDTLSGGDGDDILSGGIGVDIFDGGEGADIFAFAVGDLASWDDLIGTPVERMEKLDRIEDFQCGEDRLSFADHEGVESLADLKAWKVEMDENVMFMLQIPDTNERMLVDVDDDTKWSDLMDEDNFVF
ncbi:hemolysin type calcium-binding protein [Celeribacter persicus]|uniref:Hemolysin type calcium-binding protein n=2 Tax=Celeribacter persicus TaxID=1651082 RepID=A0A2T5H9U7_9RHOB|nr:hemolysin type calcium-binding protein [Celeribacter persicus]